MVIDSGHTDQAPTAPGCWSSARLTHARRQPAGRGTVPHGLEVEDADPGMCVPGPVGESVAVLGRVVTVMDEFLDAIAWSG
jgi:hypothetical protein